jgi:hypothetical protein
MNKPKFTPIGLGKDGNYRVQVTEQNVQNGIVFGEKSGFAKATTAEGYAALQNGLMKGEILPVFGQSAGNGLYTVDLALAAAE